MEITIAFFVPLVLLFVFHSVNVSLVRDKAQEGAGNGKDETLTRRIRIHGNFSEYIPLAVILMWFMEYHLVATWFLYVYGVAIVLGRIVMAD